MVLMDTIEGGYGRDKTEQPPSPSTATHNPRQQRSLQTTGTW